MNCRVSFILTSILGVSCASQDLSSPEADVDLRVERIENRLTAKLQIEGEEPEYFNLEERLVELGIPGLSVAFARDGKVEWARAYGHADLGLALPMTTDTYLLAGSISKPVAAVRALQLVEDGIWDLDEDINRYLNSWQVPDNEFTAREKVTLRRILTHTAGLTVWGFPGYHLGDEVPSVVEVLDGEGNTDPVRVFREPGGEWLYSGGGYTIMQLAIEETDRREFAESLQEHVLDRMGMTRSTYVNPLPVDRRGTAATGYRSDGGEVDGKWPIYPEMAAAGLWTTPSELVQYGIEMQRILQSGEDGILTHRSVVAMLDAPSGTHGLGPTVAEHTFGHGGADDGFLADLVAWKGSPYAVVIMVNSNNGSIIDELLIAIAAEYDLPGIEPMIKRIAPMASAEMEKFAGRYALAESAYDFSMDGDRLKISEVGYDYTAWFLPESELEFFNSQSGSSIAFRLTDGVVTGFRWGSLEFARVED